MLGICRKKLQAQHLLSGGHLNAKLEKLWPAFDNKSSSTVYQHTEHHLKTDIANADQVRGAIRSQSEGRISAIMISSVASDRPIVSATKRSNGDSV